jgi:2-deoxy-D-gluconate 3-dehydrogenase
MKLDELMDFSGRICVVTGAAVGIGEAIARRLHEANAYVVLLDLHHDNVHRLAGELNGGRADSAEAHHLDVADNAAVNAAMADIFGRHERIDVLVNNAGIFPLIPIAKMSPEDFQRVIDVNLTGVYNCTKAVAVSMVEHRVKGVIVNITSIDALKPSMVGLAHYDASKHGVWGFTKNAALEFAPHGIRINALAPGGIITPGATAGMSGDIGAEELKQMQEAFLARIPMHRMGEADEIAKAALFLASDMSSYMTGAQIVVDGGAILM